MIFDLRKCPNHEMHESESAGALLKVINVWFVQSPISTARLLLAMFVLLLKLVKSSIILVIFLVSDQHKLYPLQYSMALQ